MIKKEIVVGDMKKKFLAVGGVGLLVLGGLFMSANMSNESVDGGYAAYIYSRPLVGAKEFKSVLKGPSGTGLAWRLGSIVVSVTPYTMTETFSDIRASDQLKMEAEAFLVYRIDPNKVKEFVENYGAINEVENSPESIGADAYESFIQQPFRTEVRTAIAQFEGLDAPARIPQITKMVEEGLRAKLKDSPFVIESVTIGSTTPPESVTAGITRKVEATQEEERQVIELRIAQKAQEVATSQGIAIANKAKEEALGELAREKAKADAERYRVEQQAEAALVQKEMEAKAILLTKQAESDGMLLEAKGRKALDESMGENYLRLEAIQHFKDIKFPHVNVGSDAITPILDVIKQGFFR